jgi:hypothetical protein
LTLACWRAISEPQLGYTNREVHVIVKKNSYHVQKNKLLFFFKSCSDFSFEVKKKTSFNQQGVTVEPSITITALA